MEERKLQVGYARTEITPRMSVPLRGYGNTDKRMSQGALAPLYATCIALTDGGGKTVLLYTVDITGINTGDLPGMRAAIHEATGVAPDHILLSATHTHSAPDTQSHLPVMEEYKSFLFARLAEAGAQALADRAEATMELGGTQTRGMCFVRHYRMEDGSMAGDNFGPKGIPAVGHAAPADEQVQIVKFCRGGGKKDILLFNWQAHPKLDSTISSDYGKAHRFFASPDFVGPCRDRVEEQTGALFAFFLGAAGNLNPLSRIKEENPPSLETPEYGRRLADAFMAGLNSLAPARTGRIRLKQVQYEAQLDHTEDALVPKAKEIEELWKETNDFDRTVAVSRPYGIVSPYHANSIVKRATLPQQREMELDALSVGDLAFVTAPYEMFCCNGKYVKEHSPFPTTFMLTCANGGNAYIADELAFTYNSYEVCCRVFVRGTAERLADTMVEMLGEVK